MSQPANKTDQTFFALMLVLMVALFLWPVASGGCARVNNGMEIASWFGKLKVKPLPPEPVLIPPATRCLIFSATWCGTCRKLKATVLPMARSGWRIGPLPTDDIEFIDVDGRDERISKYRHTSVPTLVIVDSAGKEVARREGVQTADQLGEWIRSTRK